MHALPAPRHARRTVTRTRPWAYFVPDGGPARADPRVHRRARTIGARGTEHDIQLADDEAPPLAVVARLWLGVLSMFSLIVTVGLIGMVLGAWALGYRPVVVTSGSMAPAIRQGDVVITREVEGPKALGTQTVINFEAPDGSGNRLHRIVEVTPDGYRTKGDNNPVADTETIPPTAVRGTGVVLAPFAGFVPLWFYRGQWLFVALSIAGLVAVATMSRRRWMWATDRGRGR